MEPDNPQAFPFATSKLFQAEDCATLPMFRRASEDSQSPRPVHRPEGGERPYQGHFARSKFGSREEECQRGNRISSTRFRWSEKSFSSRYFCAPILLTGRFSNLSRCFPIPLSFARTGSEGTSICFRICDRMGIPAINLSPRLSRTLLR